MEFNGGITADLEQVHIAGHSDQEGDLVVTRCQCHGDVLEKYNPDSARETWLIRGRAAGYAGTAFVAINDPSIPPAQTAGTASLPLVP